MIHLQINTLIVDIGPLLYSWKTAIAYNGKECTQQQQQSGISYNQPQALPLTPPPLPVVCNPAIVTPRPQLLLDTGTVTPSINSHKQPESFYVRLQKTLLPLPADHLQNRNVGFIIH